MRGPLEEGRRWLEGALTAGVPLDPSAEARARNALASIDIAQARFADAAANGAAALALARAARNREEELDALSMLGFTAAIVDGDAARSAERFAACLDLSRELGREDGVATALFGLGMVALHGGDLVRAAELLPRAEAALRAQGSWWYLAGCLFAAAQVALAAGDGPGAAARCREAIALSQRLAESTALAYQLGGLAGSLALQGECARAARLFGAAEALHERNGSRVETMIPRAAHEALVARARAGLEPAAFAAAWAAGRALSPGDAIAEALDERLDETPGGAAGGEET